MSDYTCTAQQVTRLSIRRNGGITHVMFHPFSSGEQINGGSLVITGDFGPFTHTWTHIGSGSFIDFLESLEFDYAMTKLSPQDIEVFDGDKTRDRIKKEIIDRRLEGYITAAQARHFWDEICHLDLDSENDAYRDLSEIEWSGIDPDGDRLYSHLTLLNALFGGDLSDIPLGKSVRGNLEYFWREMWPIILVEIRKASTPDPVEEAA